MGVECPVFVCDQALVAGVAVLQHFDFLANYEPTMSASRNQASGTPVLDERRRLNMFLVFKAPLERDT